MGSKKKLTINPAAALFLAAAAAILFYGLFANAVFIHSAETDLRDAYEEILLMDLPDLDEEDEEILQNFQADGMEFLITDGTFAPVYASRQFGADAQIEWYIKSKTDQYQEEPQMRIRRYANVQVVRLRALVRLDQDYYIYIRREMRDIRGTILYTAIYFGAVWLLAVVLYAALRGKRPGAQAPQDKRAEADVGSTLAEAQKEFVANITHELKTPLAVISGQVEMLQSMGDEIDRNYYFASIREEIDKMSGLVSDLLDLTIMEHHMEEMEMTTVDLTDLMDYMALKYDALFKKNRIKVSLQVARGVRVTGNRMYLEQAVNNYIMNAFQHTAQGKKMRISLQAGDKARIGVYNEGEGIPQEDMERIWQGYYKKQQANHERAGRISNAGLGLYMVQKIVEQHHGSCGVENQEKGVEFWIELPACKK